MTHASEFQVYDVARDTNPITHARIRGGNGRGAVNGEATCVVSRGVGVIWKGLRP